MRHVHRCAAATALLVSATVHATPLFSWEDGTAQNWTDTNWSSPDWTDRSVDSFGATDGNFAYGFKSGSAFNWGDQVEFVNSGAPWATPEQAARWTQLAESNILLIDFTVQGERAQPLNPPASNYITFAPGLNGPAEGGGFISSYNNPVDPDTLAPARYQVVFATEYFDDIRSRTLAWDYVNAGYNFANLVATENPPGSGSWSQHFTLMHMSQNSNVAGIRSAIDNLRAYRARATDPTFAGGSSGNWSSAGSWANGVPNAVDAVAVLKGTAEAASTINLDAPATVGTLMFNNMQRNALGAPIDGAPTLYTINGTSTLTLSRTSGEAAIVVLAGANAINAPLSLQSDTVIDLAADTSTGETNGVPSANGASLTTGDITLAAGKTLRTTSVGELTVSGNIVGGAGSSLLINGRKTTIAAGGSRVVKVENLGVATTAQLDITNNSVAVDYTGTSPLAAIEGAIVSGYAGGTWTGKGIVSSTAATGSNFAVGYIEASSVTLTGGLFAGQAIDGDAVLVRYTFKGDTDLNRVVNFDDLLALAQAYGTAGGWRKGDSNYDGTVNFDDLLALAQNYGGSLSLTQSAALADIAGVSFSQDWELARSLVPEPTVLAVALAAAPLTRRRRSV